MPLLDTAGIFGERLVHAAVFLVMSDRGAPGGSRADCQVPSGAVALLGIVGLPRPLSPESKGTCR